MDIAGKSVCFHLNNHWFIVSSSLHKLDHYDQENTYYVEEKKRQDEIVRCQVQLQTIYSFCDDIIEPEAWIDTHANPRVSMPNLETYRDGSLATDVDGVFYECVHCSPHIPERLVSIAGPGMTRCIAILHLRER